MKIKLVCQSEFFDEGDIEVFKVGWGTLPSEAVKKQIFRRSKVLQLGIEEEF